MVVLRLCLNSVVTRTGCAHPVLVGAVEIHRIGDVVLQPDFRRSGKAPLIAGQGSLTDGVIILAYGYISTLVLAIPMLAPAYQDTFSVMASV